MLMWIYCPLLHIFSRLEMIDRLITMADVIFLKLIQIWVGGGIVSVNQPGFGVIRYRGICEIRWGGTKREGQKHVWSIPRKLWRQGNYTAINSPKGEDGSGEEGSRKIFILQLFLNRTAVAVIWGLYGSR